MTTVCLLPVRNEANELPRLLAEAPQFCDAIVALDDGSTDETRELLETSPLVQLLLSNPPRDGFADWDDSANRNRLLQAAAELEPSWLLSLDADERIAEDDARALRDFLANDAIPGCAYGLPRFRMWGPAVHESRFAWVFRVFAFQPGLSFPDRKLHFHIVPVEIPLELWVRTTIRLQHLATLTPERIDSRLAKYREADPESEWGTDFERMAKPWGELLPWTARPADLPVVAGPEIPGGSVPFEGSWPLVPRADARGTGVDL